MKATYVELTQTVVDSGIGETGAMERQDTVGRNIFKDPITDDGTKKSATGLLYVEDRGECSPDVCASLKLFDKVTWEKESQGLLKTIYNDGQFQNITTLTEIKARLAK